MKKLKSNIKELLCLLVIGHVVFLMACGSAGGAPLGPSMNVFPPDENLIGEWELEAVVTQSDCDEIPVGSTDTSAMTVSEDSCGYIDDDSDGESKFEECQASLDQVVLTLDVSASLSGCDYVYEEKVQLKYDPDSDGLAGTVTTYTTFTGNCDGETFNITCHVTVVVRTMSE